MKVAQGCPTLCNPMSMEFSRPEYWSRKPFPFPGDPPNPGIETWSPALQADSSPAEPQGKPKNTGVGSLSLLQWTFPTQESNRVSCMAGREALRERINGGILNVICVCTGMCVCVCVCV